MPPRRILTRKQQVAEMAKSRKCPSRNPNPHNIVFDNPEQERRYQIHRKRKLTPTRYMCEHTLNALGLKMELFNNYHELSVEELAAILRLPLNRPGAVPDGFSPKDLWITITGRTNYSSKGAKASGIQNPCSRYAQKGLAYTMFGRGDSTGVAT
ncbi:hypothetical protein KIW84_035223 [Lathyrus oleraceus]|uniref:Arabidopsis retrotransposon Orf1 C-terminal domain-containing protein n=1 Tax=Pisum sativum TaxID=3888 RepID=A0A9D4Y0T3_PEA|nr:hypothetical protein KIW84_035223 [Pisum sativum]